MPNEHDDLTDHEIGDRLGVATGCEEDRDPAARRRADVDVYGAAPHAGDEAELGKRREFFIATALGLQDPADGAPRGAVHERRCELLAAAIDDLVAELSADGGERARR